MFEITSIAAKETCDSQLVNGNNDPLFDVDGNRLSVTVHGPGSMVYAEAQAARNQRLMDRIVNSSGNAKISTADQIKENAQFLADCTVSFNNWAYKGATDKAAMLAAYSDPSIGFVTDKVQKDQKNWANFMSSSSTS